MSTKLGFFPFSSFFDGVDGWMDEIADRSARGNITCYQTETDAGTTFMFDVPGVKKEALDIGFSENGRVLKVSAARKFGDTDVKMHARVVVPEKCDSAGDVRCALNDGVLTVSVPLKKESQPRKLTIE